MSSSIHALHEVLNTFTVKIETPAADQKLLIATNAEGTYVRRFLIDTKRSVLLKSEDESEGTLQSITTFADFVERGEMWWPQSVRITGADEVTVRETKFAIDELDATKFAERFVAEQDQRALGSHVGLFDDSTARGSAATVARRSKNARRQAECG